MKRDFGPIGGHHPGCVRWDACECEVLWLADAAAAEGDELDDAYRTFYDPDYESDPHAKPALYADGWVHDDRGEP